ncbi:MAG: DUF3618 domain-containing protein, partial [Aeromicrobium sp.]
MTGRSLDTIEPGTSADELEADIRRTRQDLGDTVEALAAKLDVKAQIKSSTDQAKANLARSADQARVNAVEAVSSNWREL